MTADLGTHAATATTLPSIGFIGLGDQGLPMALAVAEAGYPLHAWARRQRSLDGLQAVEHIRHETLAELAAVSDIVCLCVSTDEDVAALLTGPLLANLRPGSILVNHGTGTPQRAVEFARVCDDGGVDFLDAPVSGGHAGAFAHTLTTLVGGPKPVAAKCETLFRTFSSHVVRLGSYGAGEMAKLLNNALMMMNHASNADILELATVLGIDAIALADVLKSGSGTNAALELLPVDTDGLPPEEVDHARDVLLMDMSIFDAAMHDRGVDAHLITSRAESGARRLPDLIKILNP
jgi:3-hydroxyisobutyrate dehydrogenase-like beta-hydroxyacid dehydrogenase